MTTSLNVTLFPDEPPVCAMGGVGGDIPYVEFDAYPVDLTVQLGNHPDPGAWCAETAARLTKLADLIADVEAAR